MSEQKTNGAASIEEIMKPQDGNTVGEQWAHLTHYNRHAGGRWENLPVAPVYTARALRAMKDVELVPLCNLLNLRRGHSAGQVAAKEDTIEAAFIAARDFVLENTPWNYLDAVADEFIQYRMKMAGLKVNEKTGKVAGTRDDRAPHRAALLSATMTTLLKGSDQLVATAFAEFVREYITADAGDESKPSVTSEKKKKGFALV